jgi:phosphate acetyltransferase
VYIASAEGGTGRSVIALGLLHHLVGTVARVGVFRPIVGPGQDPMLGLLLPRTTAGLCYQQCAGVSYQRLHDDPDDAIAEIIDRFDAVAARCDAVVIVGSDSTDVDAAAELAVNARIAVNLGAAVVLSLRVGGRGPEEVAEVVETCLDELSTRHAVTAAVVANRCGPAQMSGVADALRRFEPKTYVLPEEPRLAAASVAEVQCAVAGGLLGGDAELLQREVTGVLVAGMTAEHVLEQLFDGAVVFTSGDRCDVVLAVASAQAAEGFPSLSALIVTGGLGLHRSITALVSGLGLRLPMIATTLGTFEAASVAGSTRARLTATHSTRSTPRWR